MSMDGKHRSFQEQVEKQPDYRYDVRNEIIINNDTMIFEEEYNVKVLMLNGSAKANGNTYASLLEVGRQLEKEGLVTIEPRRGAYASQISVKDMVDILEVRQNLEGLAAFFAAQRMTKDVQEELHRVSENYDQAVADGDMAAMIKSDTRFHRIIVEASNNHVLLQMIEQLQELVLRFRYLYYSDFKRADDMPSEHEAIYEAIVAGDADAAREAADIHIQRLKELVISEGV